MGHISDFENKLSPIVNEREKQISSLSSSIFEIYHEILTFEKIIGKSIKLINERNYDELLSELGYMHAKLYTIRFNEETARKRITSISDKICTKYDIEE